ncbi:MAG: 50S ribosomal protein L29 [Candidatus Paceibacterota bacterium]|jgi:large subunit ribosomal protein L29|nr:50S ribosomal protein L29 [Candidatus Paceibacterota bacterium]MDD3548530.1 50S ribosomal protein L29 [Candidatus Paceibacterota bacterium]MDD4999073.1 50S ribosomal protein L29 [Candidatus Paceibacterota bacterium]MDD5545226.1 50S ribosomal protein L29 [Candidatus Paceibacterota bacterium]
MKNKELKLKTKEELNLLLAEDRKKLRDLKVNLSKGKVKNVLSIRMLKKEIARILTILNFKAGEEKK